MVASDYEDVKWNSERISNAKPFKNRYNWKGIHYPSNIDDWKTFEKNNPTIAIDIVYIKEKEKCPAVFPKINSNCEKQKLY